MNSRDRCRASTARASIGLGFGVHGVVCCLLLREFTCGEVFRSLGTDCQFSVCLYEMNSLICVAGLKIMFRDVKENTGGETASLCRN